MWLIIVLTMIICVLLVICYSLVVIAHDADEREREAYKRWKESRKEKSDEVDSL